MDREEALRVLGLDESASETQRVAAYWRVRAHVEARLEEAPGEALRADRRAELDDLKRAVELLTGVPSPNSSGAQVEGENAVPLPGWLVAWSVLATALVGALVVSLVYVLGGGPGGGDSPARKEQMLADRGGSPAIRAEQEVPAPLLAEPGEGPPSALMVRGNLEGARLEVEVLGSGEAVAQGPADGTRLSLQPGQYQLRVAHPECSDEWTRTLSLEAGESRELLANNCSDQGWLVVRSNVSGDHLEIDGEELGATGPTRHVLAAGEHQVRVTSEGRVAWEGQISLPAAEELTLRAVLQSDSAAGEGAQPEQSAAARAAEGEPAAGGGAAVGRQLAPPEWLERATHYLLSRYDFDRSGSLDTVEEVEAIPCNDWLAFERSLDASQLGLPLTRLYGFDGTEWVEAAFGVDAGLRHASYLHMKECGLK